MVNLRAKEKKPRIFCKSKKKRTFASQTGIYFSFKYHLSYDKGRHR